MSATPTKTRPTATIINCPSCQHELTGHYCAHCGEKRLAHHDFSLKHQLEELFEGFTHFDNKFFRTVRVMVTRPGKLTQDFSNGIRVPYMKPFQLFVVCNLLFFLLLGSGNLFALPFSTYFTMEPYTLFGTRAAVQQKAAGGADIELMATLFNNKISSQSKAFLVFFIPVIALFAALVFARKKRFFTEHLIFATHYFSFVILFYIVLNFLVNRPFYFLAGRQYNELFDISSSLAGLALLMGYFGMAARRYYQVGRGYAAVAGILAGVVFFASIYGYRMLLFYKIMGEIRQ